MKKIIIAFAALIIIPACSEKESYEKSIKEEAQAGKVRSSISKGAETSDLPEVYNFVSTNGIAIENEKTPEHEYIKIEKERIIRNADISMEVENYKNSIARIKSILTRADGYIAEAKEEQNRNVKTGGLILKVRNNKFDNTVDSVAALSKKLNYKNISAKDVGHEYIDIETRIKTKEKVLEKYYELMEKAKNLDEVLKVENNIRVLQEEIEVKKGGLRYLDSKAVLSEINVYIYKEIEGAYEDEEPGFFTKLWESLFFGLYWAEDALFGMIKIWPIFLLAYLIFLIYKLAKRRSLISKKCKG